MSKLYDLQELVEHTGLPERTIRYYLAKVLEAPGGIRGRKAFYPQETLDQLKLAKHILMGPYDPKRGEVKPSLRDFQLWLKSHTTEEISTMATMPYRIKPKALMSAITPQHPVVKNEDLTPRLVDRKEFISHSQHKENKQKPKESAAQYLNKVMGTKQTATRVARAGQDRRDQWNSFRFGDDLEIRIRQQLTPAQKQQLSLAGQLLQSMLEKEQK